ncbi:hypothetical protein C8J57DRAFT_1630697 [Mycena rebaudengoi]|nr:hypothetical protein C8J57DRAFT_1630697 [Mycena rebaudengoi]
MESYPWPYLPSLGIQPTEAAWLKTDWGPRLTSIDEEMAGIHATVAGLQSKLVDLAQSRREIIRILHGIPYYRVLDLPPEITGEIFKHYVEGIPTIGRSNPCSEEVRRFTGAIPLVGSPMLLACVCKAWREIALSTPSIWAAVAAYATHNSSLGGTENLLRCWLPRAGAHPLQLDLLGDTLSPGVFSLVAQTASRWSSLALHLGPNFLLADGEIRGHVLALRRLHILSAPPSPPITTFLDAPQLQEARLERCFPASISLPWNQLLELDLDVARSSPDSVLDVLKQCTILEVLIVRGAYTTHNTATPTFTPFQMAHLHTLRIDDVFGQILSVLDVPLLHTLKLNQFERPLNLKSFSSRTECSLRSISFQSMLPTVICDCLDIFLSIEDITITACSPDENDPPFFLTLAQHFETLGDNCHFDPGLKRVTIDTAGDNIPADLLYEMLKSITSQWAEDGPQTFRLLFPRPQWVVQNLITSVTQLNRLIKNDLNLQIEHPPKWQRASPNINSEIVALLDTSSGAPSEGDQNAAVFRRWAPQA